MFGKYTHSVLVSLTSHALFTRQTHGDKGHITLHDGTTALHLGSLRPPDIPLRFALPNSLRFLLMADVPSHVPTRKVPLCHRFLPELALLETCQNITCSVTFGMSNHDTGIV